jgi:peptidyl-prolyl cis-trans isomerase A (cyclophilin A)
VPPQDLAVEDVLAFNLAQGDPVAQAIARGEPGFTLEDALVGLPPTGGLFVEIETERGRIDCELLPDASPETVANFVGLARGLRPFKDESGQWVKRPFYDGLIFHRIDPGFVIQGGDPNADGTGGPGFVVAGEFSSRVRHDRAGILSMANRGPNTNGSQFFVTLGPTPHLDGLHPIFGVCSDAGTDVADAIAMSPRTADDRPERPVAMKSVKVSRR